MNELGTATLVQAALQGVPQYFGRGGEAYEGPDGSKCGLAVLGFYYDMSMGESIDLCREYDLRFESIMCPECGARVPGEARMISHLNDDHRADFLQIARKLGAT